MDLEPIDPETALELYLTDREHEVTDATLQSHRSRLGHFVRWCDQQAIENLNTLTGRILHEYRLWRRQDGDLAPASEKTQMDTLRVFIRWLENIDGVPPELSKKVVSPTLSLEDNTRDVMLAEEDAETVLDYLQKYEYASFEHTTITLMWHTGMRVGGIRALDVDDYDSDEQHLEVCHRPESDTPIKNKERGERFVGLTEPVCTLLTDWIEEQRPTVTDQYGREPLFPTSHGRAHVSTIRMGVYRYTRPCYYGEECPHDRVLEECDARHYDLAAQCPSSVNPHAIRRGSITRALGADIPKAAVGDRANVSREILDKHYDQRTEQEKMEQRRRYLDNL